MTEQAVWGDQAGRGLIRGDQMTEQQPAWVYQAHSGGIWR